MALHSLENMMGKKGYVKIADGVYLWGEIEEVGTSGLIQYDPRVGNPQAKIIGRRI